MQQACLVCGKPSSQARCEAHRLAPRARGNSFQPTRLQVANRDGWTCQHCGRPLGRNAQPQDDDALNVDHVIARAHGGNNQPSNLQALCGPCNRRKGAT